MLNRQSSIRISLLVTDLDNTIWDWSKAWYAQISTLFSHITEITGIEREQLISEARRVHQKHGTTEYSWLLEEMPSVQAFAGNLPVSKVFQESIHLQNIARVEATRLYPGVEKVFENLNQLQIPIVAYTESQMFWTEWRIKKMNLDGKLDVVYSQPDHDHPAGISIEQRRYLDKSEYGLKETVHRTVPSGLAKPNTKILSKILEDYGMSPSEVLYVGDSKTKDVLMAQLLGVNDAWAEYGVLTSKPEYELLRQLSHWTDKDIELEKLSISAETIEPSTTLRNSYSEILSIFQFER